MRRNRARKNGHAPPPREKYCPPQPIDGLCECCGNATTIFHLDHCHDTGAFRGWTCVYCNTGAGLSDDIERLEKRIRFLKATKYRKVLYRITDHRGYHGRRYVIVNPMYGSKVEH